MFHESHDVGTGGLVFKPYSAFRALQRLREWLV